jgi:hypothetical protein
LTIMRSMHSLYQPTEERAVESLDEEQLIGLATDLLQQLYTELSSNAITDPRFARAMSIYAPDARAQLSILHIIVDVLTRGDAPSSAVPLKRGAMALVSCLAKQADVLWPYATDEDDPGDCLPDRVHWVSLFLRR